MERVLDPCKLMTVEDLGLDRNTATDRIIQAFADWAETRIVKWIQFPRGVLLFLMVPGDLESGCFYIFDRPRRTFWRLDISGDERWGGYRQDEFEGLTTALGLKHLTERPQQLCQAARRCFDRDGRIGYQLPEQPEKDRVSCEPESNTGDGRMFPAMVC